MKIDLQQIGTRSSTAAAKSIGKKIPFEGKQNGDNEVSV
jgi:hypothetical protein